jgi:hypothetical protein
MRDSYDVPVASTSIMPQPPAAMISSSTHLRLFNLRLLFNLESYDRHAAHERETGESLPSRLGYFGPQPIVPRVLPFDVSVSILETLVQNLVISIRWCDWTELHLLIHLRVVQAIDQAVDY